MATPPEDRELEIFNSALEFAKPAERAAFLDLSCGDDTALRAQVEELLRAHEQAGGFLAEAFVAAGTEEDVVEVPLGEGPGTRIGRYKLLEKIGEGGFGVVYMADQEEPVRRRVALKIIKLGMDTRAVVARFEAERQALALMEHPGIAKVHDGGATESGRPYFVMEIVRGIAITRFCDEHQLTMRRRIDLFQQVCHAVQHAHQKGVIHRDLKPSNILVTLHDDRPVPKVIDFGIAKATGQRLTDKTLFTRFHQFIGTPAYMSPEQAGAGGFDMDTRSDIYSLGVLLYELLTGQTPFDARVLRDRDYDEIQRTIRDKVPAQPSNRLTSLSADELSTTAERRGLAGPELVSLLRGDLDWIVMKCLQKDRNRRYDSADAVALDLGRFLNHQPVLARPDAFGYRAGKFLRRHRTTVAFAGLVVAALLVGLAGTITQARRAERHAAAAETQRQSAEAERRRADEAAALASRQRDFAVRQLSRAEAINELNHFLIADAAPSGKPFTAVELLARAEDIVQRESADSDENRAELLVAIGRQYAVMNQMSKARPLLQKAYDLARKVDDPALRAKTAAALGDAIAMSGDFKRGEQLIQEALTELGDDPKHALHRAFCLELGSHLARERGDAATGVARAEEAMSIWQRSPASSALGQLSVSVNLAQSYEKAGRNREAAAAFEAAFARFTALGRADTDRAASLLNNWANALHSLGRPLEAERHYRRVIAIRSTDGTERNISAVVLGNLSGVLLTLHRFDEAADYAERALAKVQSSGDEHRVNTMLTYCASVYVQTNQSRALEILADIERRWQASMPASYQGFATIARFRSRVALLRGDLETALMESDKALALVRASPTGARSMPGTLVGRAEINVQRNRYDDARREASDAIALYQDVSGPEAPSAWIGKAKLLLGETFYAQGKFEEARVAFTAAQGHLRPTVGEEHPHMRDAARRLNELPGAGR